MSGLDGHRYGKPKWVEKAEAEHSSPLSDNGLEQKEASQSTILRVEVLLIRFLHYEVTFLSHFP